MGKQRREVHALIVWVYLCALGIVTSTVWASGSTSFRFTHRLGTGDSSNFLQDEKSWQFDGQISHSGISSQGVDLGLVTPARARAIFSRYLDQSLTNSIESNYFLISGTIERISEAVYYDKISVRPTLVVRLVSDSGDLRNGVVLRADGSNKKLEFSRFLPIGKDSAEVEVYWQLHTVGQWRLSALWVRPVVVSERYAIVRQISMLSLIGLALIAAIYTMVKMRPLHCAFLFCSIACIILLTLMGQEYFQKIFKIVSQSTFFSTSKEMQYNAYAIQKIGHVIAFALLSAVSLGVRQALKLSLVQGACAVFLFAWLTEAMQRHTATRNSSVYDLGIDSIGIILGCTLFFVALKARVAFFRTNSL